VLDKDKPDKDAVSDDDIIAECKARFELCEQAEGANRVLALDDLSFIDGNQWPDDVTNTRKNRPTPVVNHTETFINRVINNIKQQRPRIKCHPVGDGSDVEDAEVINGLVRHIEQLSTASIAYDSASSYAVKMGWGYFRMAGDYIDERSFDQEIKIKPIRNQFTVYMDPSAALPSGEDQMWCILTGKMRRILYKAMYPDAPNAEWLLQSTGDQDRMWESKEEIRLAEYYRIREKRAKLFRLRDGLKGMHGEAINSAFEDEIKSAKAESLIMKNADGSPIERWSSKRSVQWFRINGETINDRRTLPGRYIPVFRVEGNVVDLNGKIVRKGMARNMKGPQRNFNYMTAAKIERLALTPKAPWLVADGQIDGQEKQWTNANQSNVSVLVYKPITTGDGQPVPPPQRELPAPVEAGFVEAIQAAEHDLLAVAGMPHEPAQDAPGQVVSGVALAKRQGLSDQAHFQYYDNTTLAIAHCGRVMLDWIPVYYDTQRMQRIIGADGVPQMVEINKPSQDEQNPAIQTIKNDLTVGRYDVVMDTGPGYETKRIEGAETLMQLLGTPLGEVVAQKGADLVLRGLDTAYSEELADRLIIQIPEELEKAIDGMSDRAKNIIRSLQGQIKQIGQQLQAAQQDIKYGLTKTLHQEATKLQIEQSRDQRAEKDTHTDTFTKLEDTHTRAHTAIAVAEINKAGTLLDTHVKGRYDAAARKDELAAAEQAEKANKTVQ
jgi:hypothetical protein